MRQQATFFTRTGKDEKETTRGKVPRRKVQQGLRMQCTSKARIQCDAGQGFGTAAKSLLSCTALRFKVTTASFSSSIDRPCNSSMAKIPHLFSLADIIISA